MVLLELVRQVALSPVGAVAPTWVLLQDTFRQCHLILWNLEETATCGIVTLHEVVGEGILARDTLVQDGVTHLVLQSFEFVLS